MPSRAPYLVYYIVLYLFVTNCKLSLVNSFSLYVIFCTHCPTSNSLASCGRYFCNFICLLIKFCCCCCCMKGESEQIILKIRLSIKDNNN